MAAHAAACGVGSAPDPGQALGGDDLGDAGAVERCAFSGERVGDLVDGMPGASQLEDARACGVLCRRGFGSAFAGEEELTCPGPELAYRGEKAAGGVAKPGCRLGRGQALGEVCTQSLVTALGGAGWLEEELPAGPGR